MFTRNYYNWQEWYEKNIDLLGTTYTTTTDIGVKSLSGESFNVQVWQGNSIQEKLRNISYLKNMDIVLGTGETAATTADYALDNDITSDLGLSVSVAGNAADDGLHVVFTIGGTNGTGAEITIKEIGIVKGFYTSTGTTTTASLINRTVLDEPITLAAGENFSKVYELIFR